MKRNLSVLTALIILGLLSGCGSYAAPISDEEPEAQAGISEAEASEAETSGAENPQLTQDIAGSEEAAGEEQMQTKAAEIPEEIKERVAYYEEKFGTKLHIRPTDPDQSGFTVDYTDLMAYKVEIEGGASSYEGFANKYGSDYAVVYWTRGVPDNAEQIYCFLFELYKWGYYISSYQMGDPQCILVNAETRQEIVMNATEMPLYYVRVSAYDGFVNLRTGAGADFDIIKEIYNESYLPVYAEDGNWLRVVDESGAGGWVSAKYVTRDGFDYAYSADGDI